MLSKVLRNPLIINLLNLSEEHNVLYSKCGMTKIFSFISKNLKSDSRTKLKLKKMA